MGGGCCSVRPTPFCGFLPFNQNIVRQPIPENSWSLKTFLLQKVLLPLKPHWNVDLKIEIAHGYEGKERIKSGPEAHICNCIYIILIYSIYYLSKDRRNHFLPCLKGGGKQGDKYAKISYFTKNKDKLSIEAKQMTNSETVKQTDKHTVDKQTIIQTDRNTNKQNNGLHLQHNTTTIL